METRARKRTRTETENKKKSRRKKVDTAPKAENPSSAKALDISKNVNNNSTQNDQEKEEKEPAADLQCGICFEKPTVQGGLDSCSHIFCFKCIQKWSKTSNTCPFCKKRFRQILKKELNKPNKKPKKFKVKHRDMRAEEGYEPESWFTFSDSDEDDSDYEDHFGLIPPMLLDSFTLELMTWMHDAIMQSEDEWDYDEDELDDEVDDFGSESEVMFPAYIDLTNDPSDEEQHEEEEEEEEEEEKEEDVVDVTDSRRSDKEEEEVPNSGKETKEEEEEEQQQQQHVTHSPVSSRTRNSHRRFFNRNNSSHSRNNSSRSRSGSMRKRR